MKFNLKLIVGLFVILFLTACENHKIVETSTHKVKVLDINPPKRYYVKFQDLETGQILNEYISKRCSSYQEIKIGEIYNLEYQTLENSDKKRFAHYPDKRKVFCPND